MYLNNNFGEYLVYSTHRSSTDLGPIYTQWALRDIQDINGAVVISGMELAHMIADAFNAGRYTDRPPMGTSIPKAMVDEMIDSGKSFKEIIAEFK